MAKEIKFKTRRFRGPLEDKKITIKGGRDWKKRREAKKRNRLEQQKETFRWRSRHGKRYKEYWNRKTDKWQESPVGRGQNLPSSISKSDKGKGPKSNPVGSTPDPKTWTKQKPKNKPQNNNQNQTTSQQTQNKTTSQQTQISGSKGQPK